MDQLWSGDRYGACTVKRADVHVRGLDIDWFAGEADEYEGQYVDSWWM